MTTAKRDNFTPQRPSHVKTTQRVTETLDAQDGYDVCMFDLFAHEQVPQYERPKIKVEYPDTDEDDY
jgi:hypothetical protein